MNWKQRHGLNYFILSVFGVLLFFYGYSCGRKSITLDGGFNKLETELAEIPLKTVPSSTTAIVEKIQKSRETEDVKTKPRLSDFEQAMASEDFELAEKAVRKIESASGRSKEFYESSSRLFVRQRRWQEAKEILNKCLDAFPRSTACVVDLASTEMQMGSKEEQKHAVETCLRLLPKDGQCRNMDAIVKMNEGNFEGAARVYKSLLSENGGYGVRFPESLLNWQMGIALEGAKRYEEAQIYFEKACQEKFAESCSKAEEMRTKR